MDFIDWIPALSITSLLAVVLWLSKKLIATRLTASVKHEYDERIENLRTSLRQNEESFRAELRAKESQIEALRSGALSNIATRQSALHERKIKAVEQLWAAVISLAAGKNVSAYMAIIKFENAAKEAAKNENFRQIFEIMGSGFNLKSIQTTEASKARPFISPMAWALYSAYSSIIFHSIAKLQMLQKGLDKANILDTEAVTNLVKVALPHQTEYIEKYGPSAFHYLLDELESLILTELDNILQGAESDQKSIEQASRILKEAERLTASDNALRDGDG